MKQFTKSAFEEAEKKGEVFGWEIAYKVRSWGEMLKNMDDNRPCFYVCDRPSDEQEAWITSFHEYQHRIEHLCSMLGHKFQSPMALVSEGKYRCGEHDIAICENILSQDRCSETEIYVDKDIIGTIKWWW